MAHLVNHGAEAVVQAQHVRVVAGRAVATVQGRVDENLCADQRVEQTLAKAVPLLLGKVREACRQGCIVRRNAVGEEDAVQMPKQGAHLANG